MTTARKLWRWFGLLIALLVVGLSIILWFSGFKGDVQNITKVHEIVALTLLLLVAGVLIGGGTVLTARRGMLRTEMQWRESAEQSRLLLESSSEGIYSVDRAGHCTFANPACATLLGYDDPRDLLGKNMHDMIHATHPNGTPLPREACRICQALEHYQGSHTAAEVFRRRDGSRLTVEYRSSPILRAGQRLGAVLTFVDVTWRRQAEEAMRLRDGPHGRVPVGKFKIGLIAEERTPHLTNAVIGDPRVSDQKWARREGMVAFAGYPLVVDGMLGLSSGCHGT
jgi:PAS domain S-box-containing protein